MNNLSNSIIDEYFSRIEELPFEVQFHFVARLFLWHQEPRAKRLLVKYKPLFINKGDINSLFTGIIEESKQNLQYGSKRSFKIREPYLRQYSELKTIDLLLFRTMFLKQLYGIDARQILYNFYPVSKLEELKNNLMLNPRAIAVLSTHAINFLYLYEKVILEKTCLNTKLLLEAIETFDVTNDIEVQLEIYLITHSIIGESQFYYKAILPNIIDEYKNLIRIAETLLEAHFTGISLDVKLEFLVCTRLLDYSSHLETKINDEVSNSVYNQGTYLVDTINSRSTKGSKDIARSEHRNSLFIMSTLEFKPIAYRQKI